MVKINGGVCLNSVVLSRAVVDPGLQEEAPTPRVGALTYYFANIFAPSAPPPLDPPMQMFSWLQLLNIHVCMQLATLYSVKVSSVSFKKFSQNIYHRSKGTENLFALCSCAKENIPQKQHRSWGTEKHN